MGGSPARSVLAGLRYVEEAATACIRGGAEYTTSNLLSEFWYHYGQKEMWSWYLGGAQMWKWMKISRDEVITYGLLALVIIGVSRNWNVIAANAAPISALSTVAATFLAFVAVAAAVYQTREARRQAAAAELALGEMREDRRATVRPLVVPSGPPTPEEPGILYMVEGYTGFMAKNEGNGPALNGVVRLHKGNTLYEVEFGFLGAAQAAVIYEERVTELPSLASAPVFEAVYHDLFDHQHRTTATFLDGEWRQVRFENGRSTEVGGFQQRWTP